MSAENDSDLIYLALKGNHDASNKLFSKYYSSIYGYFRGRVRNQEVVSDLVQETFLRAWRKLPQVRQNFRSWIHTIASSVFLDFLRHNSRHPPLSSLTHEFDREDTQQFSPEARMLMRESIQEVLKKMPRRQRECLELTTVEHLMPGEIAKRLGLRESTVINYVSLGRKMVLNAIFSSDLDRQS